MISPTPQRKLAFEPLETRVVLSASPFLDGLSFNLPQERAGDYSAAFSGDDDDDGRRGRHRDVRVMTQNVYLGGDVGPAVGALFTGDPDTIIAGMGALWASVEATDFEARAEALVDQIEKAGPHLIGLQEVFVWRTGPAFDPAPATNVEYDFREILLEELDERGLSYKIVADTTNTDAEFPGETEPGLVEDIRLTDHALILARADLPRGHLRVSNVQEENFQAELPLPIPDGPLVIKRGWNSVDVKLRGQQFRLINAHLESFHPAVQVAQGNELLAGPADTHLPVILLGDFNSSADPNDPENQTDTYDNLIAAGFEDAWSEVHPGDPGHTCCQAADLLNSSSLLDSRIDLVLFRDGDRGHVKVLDAELLGDQPEDRTASGLWPSDHAGVAATVRIHRQPDGRRLSDIITRLRDKTQHVVHRAEKGLAHGARADQPSYFRVIDAWFAKEGEEETETQREGRPRRHQLSDDLLDSILLDLS